MEAAKVILWSLIASAATMSVVLFVWEVRDRNYDRRAHRQLRRDMDRWEALAAEDRKRIVR